MALLNTQMVISAFALLLTRVTEPFIRFVDYKRRKARWFYKKNDKRNGRQRLGQSQQQRVQCEEH